MKTKKLAFDISEKLNQVVEEICKIENRSRAGLGRHVLIEYIREKYKKEGVPNA